MGLSMWQSQTYSRNPLPCEERGARYWGVCWTLPTPPGVHLPPLFPQGPVSAAQGELWTFDLEGIALVPHVLCSDCKQSDMF